MSISREILLLTAALADQLTRYTTSLEQSGLGPASEDNDMAVIQETLRPKLAALIPWILDDLNKVHEINYATRHAEVSVNLASNKGADLLTEQGASVEHKYTKLRQETRMNKVDGHVTKLDTYRCHVNFPLPLPHSDLAVRLDKLKDALDKKMEAYMVIEVAGKTPTDLLKYRVKRAFLLEYLTQYMVKKPQAVNANLGGALCKTCGQVHRLLNMVQRSEQLTEANKSELVKGFLNERVKAQCDE